MADTSKAGGKAGSEDDAAAKEAAKQTAAEERAAREAEEADPKYSIEDLIDGSRGYLNASPHAVAGALHKGAQKHFTLEEAKQRLEEFLSTEIDHSYEGAA